MEGYRTRENRDAVGVRCGAESAGSAEAFSPNDFAGMTAARLVRHHCGDDPCEPVRFARCDRVRRRLVEPLELEAPVVSRVSRAFHTSPIPPAPSGATTSYGPSREPGEMAMDVGGFVERCTAVTAR